MSEPIAVLALRRKRDLISGTIAKYEKLLLDAQHDLAHVNSALRLFEATGEAADLPPYGEQVRTVAHLAMKAKPSVDFIRIFSPAPSGTTSMKVSSARES